jgi:protein involved in polysaccharide export with SLBB domain
MTSNIRRSPVLPKIKHFRFSAAISMAFALLASPLSFSQGFLGAQTGITAADISALRGGAAGGGGLGAAGLGGGTAGMTGILAFPMPTVGADDDADAAKPDSKNNKKQAPLPPNEFQKYLLQTTGQMLPLFGADFFENLNNSNAQYARSPVGDDYVLGAGDQLLIRIWGSTSAETTVSIDRQGAIAIPKLGTLRLAGVKAGQVDAVVKAFFSKYYKDIEVSVALGKLRKITVFVVGQSRNPGSYALSSQSTLTSALFASGGPNAGGSIRRVQLKRQGQNVAEFDLYDFLGKGDKSADIKLQDGDVLFYPRATGFMAFVGKVNNPSVYEIKAGANSNDSNETLSDYLNLAGGLPVTADPRRATLERMQPGTDQPRKVQDITLADAGLQIQIKNGDVVTVPAIVPELANAITLRGAVAQPTRMAWRQGMRVSDVIRKKSLLINPETVRKQNEVLFDNFEQERAARGRARVPSDLAVDRVLLDKKTKEDEKFKINPSNFADFGKPAEASTPKVAEPLRLVGEMTERDIATAQLGKPVLAEDSLADRIGQLNEEINLDYAVIERFSRETLKLSLLPFNLGKVFASPKSEGDLELQAGDVITVFSHKDIQVPTAMRQVFVRIEGEVKSPGIYPVGTGDNLQTILQKAGGSTSDAYLFATSLYREDVKKTQKLNMDKLLRRMESESSAVVAQIMQSGGATSDFAGLQAKIQSVQQAQKQSLDRFRTLKPEGRISLGIPANANLVQEVPAIRLENGDRIHIPPKPDFIQVFGSVNTESALLYRAGLTVKDYLAMSGVGSSADLNGAILVRANGSAISNQSYWRNDALSAQVLPGDTIFLPEKFDRESAWSQSVRTAKDFTQVLYQLGLGAAAIKTLRQ